MTLFEPLGYAMRRSMYRILRIWNAAAQPTANREYWLAVLQRGGFSSLAEWATAHHFAFTTVRNTVARYGQSNTIPNGRVQATIMSALRALENPERADSVAYPKSNTMYWSDLIKTSGHGTISAWATENGFIASTIRHAIRVWGARDELPPRGVYRSIVIALRDLEAKHGA